MVHPTDPSRKIQGISYNVMAKLQSCLSRYMEIAGIQGKPLRPADTPFTTDLCRGVCDTVGDGSWVECPFCNTRSPEASCGLGRDGKVDRPAKSLRALITESHDEGVNTMRGAWPMRQLRW